MCSIKGSKDMVASPTPNYAALKDYDIGSGSSSKTSFQEICRFLDNSDREQQFDYKMLIKAFKYLQKCSLTSSVGHLLDAGVVQMASRTYDKLVQLDYSKREVLSSILELLYLIEDLSESVEGKALCGKYFVDRLLALTTTRVLAVTLHRAAVETLCGIITKSAPNQQRVIDDRVSCLKLFKHCLPNCGDFQLQASLTEVFYRLLKQERNLLDLIGEKSVRDAMEILLQKQKPDLLSEIKEIVFLLNESMGPNRSVYSFLADKILLNGENVAPSEQKLINFGKGHLSFYQTDSNSDGPTILDVEYGDILEIKMGSKSILEMVVQDDANVFSAKSSKAMNVNQLKQVRLQISMNLQNFSFLERHVLPSLRARTLHARMANSHINTGVRKSSMGILIPLPKEHHSTFQPRKELEPTLPASRAGVLLKNYVPACANSKLADEIRYEVNGATDTRDDGLAKNKGSFSEEPMIVKATPQGNCPSHPSILSKKNPPAIHSRIQDTELGSKVAAGNDETEEDDVHVQTRVSSARNARCVNDTVTPRCGQISGFECRCEDGHYQARCDLKHDLTKFQTNSTANSIRSGFKTVEKDHMQVSWNANKECTVEALETGPQRMVIGDKLKNQSAAVEIGGKVTLSKGFIVANGAQSKGYKSKPSPTQSQEVKEIGGFPLQVNQSAIPPSIISDLCLSEKEQSVEGVKETRECSNGKITETAEELVFQNGPSDRKVRESNLKRSRDDVPTCPEGRLNPFARRTCSKATFQCSISKSESGHSLDSGEEWAPDEGISHTIETANDKRRVGVAKGRRQLKGKDRLPCTAGKKCSSEKSSKSKRRVHTTLKSNGVQKRQTTHTDVYSFTSEEGKQTQLKTSFFPRLEKIQLGQRSSRNDRANPSSFTRIQGASRLVSRALAGITQNQKEWVQKDDKREGQIGDEDKQFFSKPLPPRQENEGCPMTDTVQKSSRIDRWKTSMYTKPSLPVSSSNPVEANSVSSATSAREMGRTTGSDTNLPDTLSALSDDKGLQVITALIKEFKGRVKSEAKRKMTDIVSDTSQRIQHNVETAQRQIQKDVAEFVEISKDKFGQLSSKLEGQTKRMRLVYEQFQKDFSEHIQQYEKIVEAIDETDHELLEIARKQGQGHNTLFEHLQESALRHLAEADEKILSINKASNSMFGLKPAVERLMRIEQ